LSLENLRLIVETGLLLVLKHRLDQFAHDRTLFRLQLANFDPLLLVLLPHLVQAHSRLVALFVKLRLLVEIGLLSSLDLSLALFKFVFKTGT